MRRSYREGGTVKNEALGNLSYLPEAVVELIRRALQGETFVPVAQAFQGIASRAQGHVHAVAEAMQRLGFAKVLASARHLPDGGLVRYDLTSSYFEGSCCPLARRGYSRDGRRGTLQVNYGVITNAGGCPVAVSAYDGNTADRRTFLPAVQQVREQFGW